MAQNHEDTAAELHAAVQQNVVDGGNHRAEDATGAGLPVVEKAGFQDYETGSAIDGEEPSEHEKKTLRRIGDKFPASAYLIAVVELCERFTCMLLASLPGKDDTDNVHRLWLPGTLPELHRQPSRWT